MKLVHGDLSGEIVNEQKECVEWIIESPELFSKYVGELYKQANKDEGEFVSVSYTHLTLPTKA